jgi:hypothetical protein
MAMAILEPSATFIHMPSHDLESFVYVIIYIWTYFSQPGEYADVKPDCNVASWFNMEQSMSQIYHAKNSHMLRPCTAILPSISPQWRRFNDILLALITKAHRYDTSADNEDPRPINDLTHDFVIDKLKACLALVPSGSEVYLDTSLKRKSKKGGTAGVVRDPKRKKTARSIPESQDTNPWAVSVSAVASGETDN